MNNIIKQTLYTQRSLAFFKNFKINNQLFVVSRIYTSSSFLLFFNVKKGYASLLKIPSFFLLSFSEPAFHQNFVSSFWLFSKKSLISFSASMTKTLVFGTLYGYYNIIQFVGFRFRQRWFRKSQVLKYRVGYSKRVWVKCPDNFVSVIRKISPKKRTHFFFSPFRFKLRGLIEQVHGARPSTLYKGRGVNIKEQPMVLKEGKKAIW